MTASGFANPGHWVSATARLRGWEGRLFQLWEVRGYQEVLPPILLPLTAVERASPAALLSRTLHVIGAGGELLALRSDWTASVAWMVSRRGDEGSGPLRLCYRGSVVRKASGNDEGLEAYQAGLELVTPKPDAAVDEEVARIAAESLLALNLGGAVLEFGHWGMVGPLMGRIAWPPEGREELEAALNRKSVPALQELARRYGETPELRLLLQLLHLGGRSADVERLRPELRAAGVEEAWDSLRSLEDSLGRAFPLLAIRLDPTDVRHWSYYTGLTIKAFSPRHPNVILSGGRYDGLYPALGRPFGAIGFAVHLSRLLEEAWA